jgi:hypothetical protein
MGFLRDLYGARSKDFIDGMKEGITLYAWWKDGVQYVGTTGTTLKDALEEVEELKERSRNIGS